MSLGTRKRKRRKSRNENKEKGFAERLTRMIWGEEDNKRGIEMKLGLTWIREMKQKSTKVCSTVFHM